MDNYNKELLALKPKFGKFWKEGGGNFISTKLNDKTQERIMNNSWFSCVKQSKYENLRDISYIPKINVISPDIVCNENRLRVKTIRLNPSKIQKEKIKESVSVARAIYNKCVEISKRINDSTAINLSNLRKLLACGKKSDVSELTEYQKEIFDRVHSSIRDDAIRDFIKAYTLQKQLLREGKIKHFDMKFRRKKDKIQESIAIQHQYLLEKDGTKGDYLLNPNKKGIYRLFPWKWSNEILKTYRENLPSGIDHDCRLIMRTTGNNEKFYLYIPMTTQPEQKIKMNNAVSLDPGVKIFQTTYDTEGTSYKIGENDIDKIDRLSKIAQRMREGKKRIWVDNRRVFVETVNGKERKGLMKAARNVEQKIKNKISDIHRKTAKFLCEKYDTIIIPNFQTKQMSEKKDENGKWKRKITSETTRKMIRWGHYQFRQLLIAKGEITGTNVYIGTEEWTSKTCGNCFVINDKLSLKDREFCCSNCDYYCHRDVNAARNIMLLNFDKSGTKLATSIKLNICKK